MKYIFMIRISKFYLILFALFLFFSMAKAQPNAKINSDFLAHLMHQNLELERLAYYRIIDFSELNNINLAQDLSYLSYKYNDTLLLKKYSYFAKDTNDLVCVFYAALLLNANELYLKIQEDLRQQKLSNNKLLQVAELIELAEGKVYSKSKSNQFCTTTQQILKLQKKSLALAAIMSIILPGLGKYYLMQNNEASSAIVLNLIFAAPLLEIILRFGIASVGTMLCGVVFLPVYLASIYGTISAKKVLLKKLNIQLKNEVRDYCAYQLHH